MAASRSASLLHSVFQSVISTQHLLAADSQAIHASGTALSSLHVWVHSQAQLGLIHIALADTRNHVIEKGRRENAPFSAFT
jgi:hypothetical protein